MRLTQILLAGMLTLLFIGCGGSTTDEPVVITDPPDPTRSFKMGFTPWLYEASQEAIDVTYSRLITHGDIIKHHLQGGIPWQESLDGTDYHPNVESEIQGRLDKTPVGTTVFLAIDSLNTERDTISPNWGESDNQTHTGEWVERSWGSAEVIQAYISFAIDMIDRFEPTHFEYGTEVSELILNNPAGYVEYLIFAEAVHTTLSALYPELKLMTSIAFKSPDSASMQLIEASYGQLMPFTDVLGISTYPYVFFDHTDRGDTANLPADWLSQASDIAGDKPMAISETGWIGENLTIDEFQYSEQSDETKQSSYVNMLLSESEALEMEFVIWWTTSDFDTLWNNELQQSPVAKIWKDIGLYDQNQNQRMGLRSWDDWLIRTHSIE
ncbi:MAG: hypothetical protein KUG78_03005 [Kangiellaceae bacterium]|nr:hypothetical protein [Kangiellaceae bacterium]